MTDFRADLHCHSHCSDGTDSPLELLNKAKSAGLQGLSITDHDTTLAYTPEVFARARELDIHLLPGVELSSVLNNTSVHILGYAIDLQSPLLRAFLSEMVEKRDMRNQEILKRLERKGFVIEPHELHAIAVKTVGRPHIAEIMVRKGYVSSVREAFERFLKDGGSCYVPGARYTPADVIAHIHKANGKAVLAHPHVLQNSSLVRELLELPFDGLECYYANFHGEQESRWLQIARKKGWIATGGSDYHGTVRPNISLGCSWVGWETFSLLNNPQ